MVRTKFTDFILCTTDGDSHLEGNSNMRLKWRIQQERD